MQLKHLKTVIEASDGPNRICAMAWSPNNMKLAVALSDKTVHIFDETGERKDRFPTKASDAKISSAYYVCALAFSPDSSKLAVAQSDGGVFIYKLGLEWGEKKSICNKFIQSNTITSLIWPKDAHQYVIYGSDDGKVRAGVLKSNKAIVLYQTESFVVSLAASLDGKQIVSGHMDCSIVRYDLDDRDANAQPFVPTILEWGESVIVSGTDGFVLFYDKEGRLIKQFDYTRQDDVEEFSTSVLNPAGNTVVLGGFDKLYMYDYSSSKLTWVEVPPIKIAGLYCTSALAWKPDGSRLVVSNMCGAVEILEYCLRKSSLNGKFELNYISPSRIQVKRLTDNRKADVQCQFGYDLEDVKILEDQFLVARTCETLIIADVETAKVSEIPWLGSGNEKFFFTHPGLCLIYNAGELSIAELGLNSLIGTCRTEYMNPHLVSIRWNEERKRNGQKRVAYLADRKTVDIMDINTGANIATIPHNNKLDWLELSVQADKLLFRDKHRQLFLYDIAAQKSTTLLTFCSYVQWVPGSDVIVAQSNNNLCVWYSVDSPEKITMSDIKGDVEDIQRSAGKTEVIVDEGLSTVAYQLDEGLIEFGQALEEKDYIKAMTLLESLDSSEESTAMWNRLGKLALKERQLVLAQRCFAATGDIATCLYLKSVNEKAYQLRESSPHQVDNIYDHYSIRARLAVLEKQFKQAETIYLEQGRVDEAMDMYQELHKWDLSIKVAESRNHPDLDNLRHNYYKWLVESGQEEKAAQVKEDEGDYHTAVKMYLKAGLPSRALSLLEKQSMGDAQNLMDQIATSLINAGLYEKAGKLLEKMNQNEKALDVYRKGEAFRLAIDLSRRYYPKEVTYLEEQWADNLMSKRQTEAAVNHYIEAGKLNKALDAACDSKQWKKVSSLVESIGTDAAKPYYRKIAEHHLGIKDYTAAEKYFVAAGDIDRAVDVLFESRQWERAFGLAKSSIDEETLRSKCLEIASRLEADGDLKEAENVLVAIGEVDRAIAMYKNLKMYEQMVKLVTKYHPDLLGETHLFLAKILEDQNSLTEAEKHYVQGNDWKSAVNMYCVRDTFEEGYRVAKQYGGALAAKQVAYLWAKKLGGETAVKLLTKFGLLDEAIEFAVENGHLDFAFELANATNDKAHVRNVHLKHAVQLEDSGKYQEAEKAFIAADKPKEAILMFIHNCDWENAYRIAEKFEPESLHEVLAGQAKYCFAQKDYSKAELLSIRAQKPDLMLQLYRDAIMWKEAIRFAKEYLPVKVADLHDEYDRYVSSKPSGDGREEFLATARACEQQRDYAKAIDYYLKISSSSEKETAVVDNAWGRAVEIAIKFVPERCNEVVRTVSQRLADLKRFEEAARLYCSIEAYKDAIDLCLAADMWHEAKRIASAMAPKYLEYVESAHVKSLKASGQADALASFDILAALDMYVSKNEWEKCMEKALSTTKIEIINKYLLMYVAFLVRQKKFDIAVKKLQQYGVPIVANGMELYNRIGLEILKQGNADLCLCLRDVLFKLVKSPDAPPIAPQIEHYLFIAHLISLRDRCIRKKELWPLANELALSLLRYTDIIPVDQTYYDAGRILKQTEKTNMAFVCWNRYLDLSEAIEDGKTNTEDIDGHDFEGTDVPQNVDLPKDNLDEHLREEVRDWILGVSLDHKIDKSIDKRTCESCSASIYAGTLSCPECHTTAQPCIVTGFPIYEKNMSSCSSCKKQANRDSWNKFVLVEKICPWCNSSQLPVYAFK